MVRTFLEVYMELGSYFVSARTNKRHHHHHHLRGVHQENSLVYAMYVYAGYVHMSVVRWTSKRTRILEPW